MPDLTVVYEAGVFKPILPLSLPEGQQFQIRILELEATQVSLDMALQPLVQRGLLTLPHRRPGSSLPEMPFVPLTRNEMEDEFEAYGVSQSPRNLLSDSIIEDRGPL